MSLFLRVALRNAYVPRPLDAYNLLRLLPERTEADVSADPYTTEASRVANKICRAITFELGVPNDAVQRGAPPAKPSSDPSDADANAVSNVLYMVSALDHLPNLRHVALRYTDQGYDDAFAQLSEPGFPAQVRTLSFEYAYSAPTLGPLAAYFKSLYTRHRDPRVTLDGIRHLAVAGAPPEFLADMLEVCPNAETVEVARPSRLNALVPLPPSVRTLVVRQPGKSLDEQEMRWWQMESAVENGLFTCGPGSARIVVRSGTPAVEAFVEMSRRCRRTGVQVVYEREEAERRHVYQAGGSGGR